MCQIGHVHKNLAIQWKKINTTTHKRILTHINNNRGYSPLALTKKFVYEVKKTQKIPGEVHKRKSCMDLKRQVFFSVKTFIIILIDKCI